MPILPGMDAFALGLRNACKIIADGRIDEFVKERYASYHSGIGAKILSGSTDLEELSRYALALDEVKLPKRQTGVFGKRRQRLVIRLSRKKQENAMKYLIGIDLGTSAVKAARLDTDGNILDAGAAEYPLYQPQNGYAEQTRMIGGTP